ncbi:MAG: hypothetical protein FJX76_13340 [Armatimonadetes bacterium]|nr:hypothetical protein [Armatimonadota bacterium]
MPARTAIIAYRYASPGVPASPPLVVRFATDRKNPRGSQREYKLEVVACDDKKGGCGRVYHLAFGDETRYIELHDE